MTTKVCQDCGEEKPIDEFPLSKSSRGGRLRICGKCKYLRYKYPSQARMMDRQRLQDANWQPPALSQAVIAQLEVYKFEARNPAGGAKRKAKRLWKVLK